jgi:hypothetical protein
MGKPNQKINPERQRTRFTKEFKLEAVQLLKQGQKPVSQLAQELGIASHLAGASVALFLIVLSRLRVRNLPQISQPP